MKSLSTLHVPSIISLIGFVSLLYAGTEIPADRLTELNNMLVQDCGSCHGLQFKGGLGPAIKPDNLSGKSVEYLSEIILNGRNGTAMPPWKEILTQEEARWMANTLLKGTQL